MLTHKQKEDFSSLRVEIIDLNILAHFFIRKINRFEFLFHNTSRHHIFEEFVALRYMENGLILHLTNLDDGSSYFSFKAVAKELNRTIKDQNQRNKLNKVLKGFRTDLGKLKNKHRNYRIAHLNYKEDLNLDEFLNFDKEIYPLIKSANLIADLIWGEKIDYKFKLGTFEGILDFRKLTEDLKIDIGGEKDF